MATASGGPGQVYFEDISAGTEIGGRIYGPIESTDFVRFCSAWETNNPLHTYQKWCLERGYKDVVMNGPLKQALLISWLDNWIGEDGFLKVLNCQHRALDYHDDLLTASGVLTKAYEVDGLGYADCDIKLTNQRGEISCPGTATVVLPRRGGNPAPLAYEPPAGYAAILARIRASGGQRIMEATADQAAGDLIPEEARTAIGIAGPPSTWPEPLDRATVRRFCDATFEEKLIYKDEAYARKSRYGGLCAPPICVLRGLSSGRGVAALEPGESQPQLPGLTRSVPGGIEAEWFRPVRLGDSITQVSYLSDLAQRSGRNGPLVVVTRETLYTNQRQELVARSRQTSIRMP